MRSMRLLREQVTVKGYFSKVMRSKLSLAHIQEKMGEEELKTANAPRQCS